MLEEKERVVSTLQGKADGLARHPVDPKALYRSIRKHNFYNMKLAFAHEPTTPRGIREADVEDVGR